MRRIVGTRIVIKKIIVRACDFRNKLSALPDAREGTIAQEFKKVRSEVVLEQSKNEKRGLLTKGASRCAWTSRKH